MNRFFRLTPLAFLFVAACAGPRPADPGPSRPEAPTAPRNIDHAEYEDFDASRYREDEGTGASRPSSTNEHDVPAALMSGRVSEGGSGSAGTLRNVSGYRVQVFQSADKTEADQRVNAAIAWWTREAEARDLAATPQVYTLFRQPYYRVRVGNFATRAEAERMRAALGREFPGAFVVQDRVTVRQ